MKEHRPLTELIWEKETRNQQKISTGDYEEWRNHPCTIRLFNDLERHLLREQAALAMNSECDPAYITAEQKKTAGIAEIVERIFSWAPENIILEDNYAA